MCSPCSLLLNFIEDPVKVEYDILILDLLRYSQSVPIIFELSIGFCEFVNCIKLFVFLVKINSKYKPFWMGGKLIVILLFELSTKYNAPES